MSALVGSTSITGAYIGSTPVAALYVGATKVWPTTGWAAYAAAVLADTPDLFVRLDSATPTDLSGNARTLTARSGTWTGTTVDPTMGTVIDNRSSTATQRAAWNTTSVLSSATWAFEAVATSANPVAYYGLIVAWASGHGAGLFSSGVEAAGISGVWDSAANYSHSALTAGWHHLCVTRNGTAFALYVDGAQIATQTVTSTQTGTGKSVEIATYQNDSLNYRWQGLMHSVGYYAHSLTGSQVAAHAAAIGL